MAQECATECARVQGSTASRVSHGCNFYDTPSEVSGDRWKLHIHRLALAIWVSVVTPLHYRHVCKVENDRFSTSNYRLFSRGASSPESPIYTPIFFFNSRAPGPEWWQKEGWGSSRCFQDSVYATLG